MKDEEQTLRPCTPEDPCLLLVVEDDSLIKGLLDVWSETGRLRKAVKLRVASTCQEALELIASTEFEVILLDLGLPDSEGLDTLDRIIGAVEDRTPVIVFVGALPPHITEDDLFRHHAADIIFKPGPEIDELMRLIHYAASRHRIRVRYLNMIAAVSKECSEAKAELRELKTICEACSAHSPSAICDATSIPGPGIQRLERIIGRIGKLAVGS